MKYIIHRGITSKIIKENSYTAIKKAIFDNETMGVEFDVRLTKDNVIVLSHNSILGTSYIENMNYKDILKRKYLTTLDMVLNINTNKILLIDIKVNNNYKLFGDVLSDSLKDINKNIYLVSLDRKIIKYLKKKVKYKVGIISFYYKNNNYPISVLNYKTISNKSIKRIKDKLIFLWTIASDRDIPDVEKKFENFDDYFLIINKNIWIFIFFF